MSVHVKALQFAYGPPLFDGLSCSFSSGRVTGILGENGCGKSTLLKMIAGIERPQAGMICWGSESMAGWSPEQRARLMGYLGQGMRSAWAMPVRDVVALGLREVQETNLNEAMKATDCAHLAERKVTELSAGELQRVMLARTLVGDPALILADEPTTGLDPRHQQQVFTLLQNRARAGATVLVVLHDLNAAQTWCDDVVILSRPETDAAHVVAQGQASDVLTPERIRAVFGVV